MAHRRPVLPAVLALALAAALVLIAAPSAFVTGPATAPRALAVTELAEQRAPADADAGSMALGAATGLLIAQPAHATMLYDEILPYAGATTGAILWGLVLGFVLLRLQEAFPE
ncbi:unnamed protein product [Polarella glacialis]|jgi:hypothetical protein|uniref:Uncharacterized protein n=1 Tax=Polarella glacialis TaxID=89957 RepID=A0A813D1K1_POLGL|nr:unnamed protein product [Polarella glacialis]CAE8582165.1 unnamed protein product [Polarella glacialis]CAE8582166.1 unnamed protein product [Polarella glacialis]CAE8651917.1 unnamed protein product [Polarella glacialis]CAE8651918.1 unnamed protein product [Polarella glacialis]